MKNINSSAEIKIAIQNLEIEHEVKGQLLKEQLYATFESLKPVNLIKSTLHDITSSPYLIENMLGSIIGMASGYLSRKIAVGASENIFRRIVGSVLQFGVTNVVSKHSDVLKTVGNFFMKHMFHKNEENTERI